MKHSHTYQVIIIGGSFAGLSAALTLGRSMRKILIIDNDQPCNKMVAHSHNFLTRDGSTPNEILDVAREQVLKYDSVTVSKGLAVSARKFENLFEISMDNGDRIYAGKLLLATGITDVFPGIPGFSECWGRSILHCPYCHGYEVKQKQLGILGNGDLGLELAVLVSNWSDGLTVFTNGTSGLTTKQVIKLHSHGIKVVEKEVAFFEHLDGKIKNIVFADQTKCMVDALFTKPGCRQKDNLPFQLHLEINDHGLITIDECHRTNIYGIFAAGDNSSVFRALSVAIAAGTRAGASINKELIEEAF